MPEKKANKTIKARDLKPAEDDPQLSERIDTAPDRAGFDEPLALPLRIVPGLNFFWD